MSDQVSASMRIILGYTGNVMMSLAQFTLISLSSCIGSGSFSVLQLKYTASDGEDQPVMKWIVDACGINGDKNLEVEEILWWQGFSVENYIPHVLKEVEFLLHSSANPMIGSPIVLNMPRQLNLLRVMAIMRSSMMTTASMIAPLSSER